MSFLPCVKYVKVSFMRIGFSGQRPCDPPVKVHHRSMGCPGVSARLAISIVHDPTRSFFVTVSSSYADKYRLSSSETALNWNVSLQIGFSPALFFVAVLNFLLLPLMLKATNGSVSSQTSNLGKFSPLSTVTQSDIFAGQGPAEEKGTEGNRAGRENNTTPITTRRYHYNPCVAMMMRNAKNVMLLAAVALMAMIGNSNALVSGPSRPQARASLASGDLGLSRAQRAAGLAGAVAKAVTSTATYVSGF
jgi:hypothetical protein